MSIHIELDVELLIALVEDKAVLWNKASADYKDRKKTLKAWDSICHTLKNDFYELEEVEQAQVRKEIIKRWSNVRDAYVRYRRKAKEAKEGGTRLKKYIYEDQLKFFKKMQDGLAGDSSADGSEGEIEADVEVFQEDVSKMTTRASKWESRKRKLNEGELHTILDQEQPQHTPSLLQHTSDSHLSFFKGVIPALKIFNDDDVVQFQMGVLKLISDIRQRKQVKVTF